MKAGGVIPVVQALEVHPAEDWDRLSPWSPYREVGCLGGITRGEKVFAEFAVLGRRIGASMRD